MAMAKKQILWRLENRTVHDLLCVGLEIVLQQYLHFAINLVYTGPKCKQMYGLPFWHDPAFLCPLSLLCFPRSCFDKSVKYRKQVGWNSSRNDGYGDEIRRQIRSLSIQFFWLAAVMIYEDWVHQVFVLPKSTSKTDQKHPDCPYY